MQIQDSLQMIKGVGRGVVATRVGALALGCLAAASIATGTNEPLLSGMDCVLEPSVIAELGSRVPGLVDETFHEVGDYVQEGALLAQLVDDVERLNLSIAIARAEDQSALQLRTLASELGERTRKRNHTPGLGAAISAQTLDQLKTEAAVANIQVAQERRALALAELEVQRAEALVAQRRVTSPITGSIMKRYASKGEYVDGDPVYKIAQLDPLHVEVIVPVDYFDVLEIGMKANISLHAAGFSNKVHSAEISRIDAVADAASATYGVRIVIDNPDLTIPSGLRCSVDFIGA